jgi:hypothetical protein
MYTNRAEIGPVSRTRDRIAMVLMGLAGLAAAYALVTAIGVAVSAGPATQQVEWWRALGFFMFAALFGLLAFWPRRYPGLWELLILDKAVLTIVEMTLIQNHAANALSSAVVDGILTLVIAAAYVLSKGYLSWRH